MASRRQTRQLVEAIEAKALKNRSWAVRLADDLTSFFGGVGFLILNLAVFLFWILANNGNLPGVPVFDPFPFPLLTTAVSLEAIILTTIVLMSQNRSSLISSLREEMDMQVNLIAEREITKSLKLLKVLLDQKGIKVKDRELEKMLVELDTSYMERELTEQLKPKKNSILKKVTGEVEKTVDTVKSSL